MPMDASPESVRTKASMVDCAAGGRAGMGSGELTADSSVDWTRDDSSKNSLPEIRGVTGT